MNVSCDGLKIESVRAERRAQKEGREQRQESERERKRFLKSDLRKTFFFSWVSRVVHGRS